MEEEEVPGTEELAARLNALVDGLGLDDDSFDSGFSESEGSGQHRSRDRVEDDRPRSRSRSFDRGRPPAGWQESQPRFDDDFHDI